MFCVKCQKDVSDCTCPDIAERLRSLSDGSHHIQRWCLACDQHYSQCKCENPVWGMRTGGKLT